MLLIKDQQRMIEIQRHREETWRTTTIIGVVVEVHKRLRLGCLNLSQFPLFLCVLNKGQNLTNYTASKFVKG